MTMTLADSTLRAGLHPMMSSAWSPKKIYDDAPYVKPSPDELPRAFCHVQDMTPNYAHQQAGFGQAVVPHFYALTLQRAWPTSGTIDQAKVADVQAILDLLTADTVFLRNGTSGYRREVVGILFNGKAEADLLESYYQVTVVFQAEVITGV